jgi:hypothetical protein
LWLLDTASGIHLPVRRFLKSLDIPWPSTFVVVMARVNIINLNMVQLPAAACLNPSPTYYSQFNGAPMLRLRMSVRTR